jgi:hypothetical protein
MPAKGANEVFSRTIVIGQIPGGVPRVVVDEHVLQGSLRIDAAMGTGHLPHAIEEAANVHIRG